MLRKLVTASKDGKLGYKSSISLVIDLSYFLSVGCLFLGIKRRPILPANLVKETEKERKNLNTEKMTTVFVLRPFTTERERISQISF